MLERTFRFLTGDDQRLLLERASRAIFRRHQVIVEEGSRRQAIFVLRSGAARVERAHLGRGIALARLGAGSVFGEMAFLEHAGASASVVADEDVEVDVIEGADVHSLLGSVAGMAARFYQSLAVDLSRRLRETSALIPPLIVEDVPQVNRFHAQRASLAHPEDVPPALVEQVEAFKTAMAHVDWGVREGRIDASAAQAEVSSAGEALCDALEDHVRTEAHLEPAVGAYVFRETFAFTMQSALVDRCFSKPRGYAGDYYTIEVIYRNAAEGAGRLGPYVDRWALDSPTSRAVRNRRAMLTGMIADVAARSDHGGPVAVTSLASGPARELFDLFAAAERPDVCATCVDGDAEALAYAANVASQVGVADRVSFVQDNVMRLAQGRGSTALSPQHMIYSAGLMDYLGDLHVVQLLDWIHEHLMPGGLAVIGNIDASNPRKAYLDHVLEWELIHRTPDDLRALFARSKFGGAPVDVTRDRTGVQLLALCLKS